MHARVLARGSVGWAGCWRGAALQASPPTTPLHLPAHARKHARTHARPPAPCTHTPRPPLPVPPPQATPRGRGVRAPPAAATTVGPPPRRQLGGAGAGGWRRAGGWMRRRWSVPLKSYCLWTAQSCWCGRWLSGWRPPQSSGACRVSGRERVGRGWGGGGLAGGAGGLASVWAGERVGCGVGGLCVGGGATTRSGARPPTPYPHLQPLAQTDTPAHTLTLPRARTRTRPPTHSPNTRT